MWLLTFLTSLLAGTPDVTWKNVEIRKSPDVPPPRSTEESHFWDWQAFSTEEKQKLVLTALDLTELEGYIDWDLLHDNYVNALLSDATKGIPKMGTTPTITSSLPTIEDSTGLEKTSQRERRRLDDKEGEDYEVEEGEENEEESDEEELDDEDRQLAHRKRKRHHHHRHKHHLRKDLKRAKRESEQNKALTTSSTSGSGAGGSILIPDYNYSLGNCPGAGNSPEAVQCAPSNLKDICDKYNTQGSFRACLTACEGSFCCIHNAPDATNTYAPNCNQDVNCAQWAYCYIAWWKLADHIGPATRLRVEQHDPFYDVTASEITGLLQSNDVFYKQFLFHFFKNSATVIQLGTVQVNATLANFDIDRIILNSTYWETDI